MKMSFKNEGEIKTYQANKTCKFILRADHTRDCKVYNKGILFCSGCHNKISQTKWLKRYISHISGSWEVQVQSARMGAFWSALFLVYRRLSSCFLMWQREKQVLFFLFLQGQESHHEDSILMI